MYLDAVNQVGEIEIPAMDGNRAARSKEVFAAWEKWVPSHISHHGMVCCEIAREWISDADFSSLSGGNLLTGPRWLRNKFKWGPSGYPIYWCEAVRSDTLDCGALAALAHEVFSVRGVQSFRAQFVQRFSEVAAAQWSCSWSTAGVPTAWISDDLIYHEGCAIAVGENEIKVWDASAGWWLDPRTTSGYGSLAAIRIHSSKGGESINWGTHEIPANEWQAL